MSDDANPTTHRQLGEEATGVVVGLRQSLVAVRLDDDSEVLCRMHRRILSPLVGVRVRIRYAEKKTKPPLIVEVLED